MKWIKNQWLWIIAGLLCIYARGLFLTVMDVDASQYASISMEMEQSGNWLEVLHRGKPYLDKPPLLFWSAAAAFRLLGVATWSYKLPSFLAAVLAVYAVFRFSCLFYSRTTAHLAALMLSLSLGMVIMTNDVRADTLLLSATTCAVWLAAEYLHRRQWRHLIACFLSIGAAMLAKGPIGLVMPMLAVGTHLLLHRAWRDVFRWEWIAGLLVTALALLPMCWGLYHQFDLHPEVEVNGRTGVSGLYFFFWEQSFGRITGENVWKNDTSPLYFTHVFAWAFLPWSLLLPGALWQQFRHLFRRRLLLKTQEEGYALGGFLLTFVALSTSRYKLPHYIFIVLPWASVLTAHFLVSLFRQYEGHLPKIWKAIQWLVWIPLLLITAAIPAYIFPTLHPAVWAVPVAFWALFAWNFIRKDIFTSPEHLVRQSALVTVAAFFMLNFYFYPRLLPYQSSSTASMYARQHSIPLKKAAFYHRHGHALDFYAGRILPQMDTPKQVYETAQKQGELWLFTNAEGKSKLDTAGVVYEQYTSFYHFQPAFLKAAFLSPTTRPATLEPAYWLKILP